MCLKGPILLFLVSAPWVDIGHLGPTLSATASRQRKKRKVRRYKREGIVKCMWAMSVSGEYVCWWHCLHLLVLGDIVSMRLFWTVCQVMYNKLTQGHACAPEGVASLSLCLPHVQNVHTWSTLHVWDYSLIFSHRGSGCPSEFPCHTVIPTYLRLVTFLTVTRIYRGLAIAELPCLSRPSP